MLVLLSLYVMLSILLSILVCAAASLFCACLVSVQVSAHSWQHTGVVHLSLQADGKVAFEDIPVFGICRPVCHDSSLYLSVAIPLNKCIKPLAKLRKKTDLTYVFRCVKCGI